LKVHAGAEIDLCLIHPVVVKAADVHDLTSAAELLHGDEQILSGHAYQQGIAKRPEMERMQQISGYDHVRQLESTTLYP
jgi:IS5 family transposase